MEKQTIQKVYPLTPMQEGMMYHSIIEPKSSFYFTYLDLHVTGHLDMAILGKSVEQLIRQTDILRTAFVHKQLERPRQVVFTDRQTTLHFENIAHLPADLQQQHLTAYKKKNQSQSFDLAKDVLFRLAVFQTAEETYQFIWSNHHILIDGWSLGLVMKKLFRNYEALRHSQTIPLESERPYGDYIKWLEKQDKEEAFGYWEQRVAGFEQATPLPQKNLSGETDEYRNETFSFVWDQELVSAIKQLANRYQVTAPNVFQALWGLLLSKYNNTNDVMFGTVVSGRPSAISGIENMVGLFINTIPVRIQSEKMTTFADLFLAVQRHALEAEQFDFVPLYEIQNRSPLNQHLINHLLAFENFPLDRELENDHFEKRLGFSAEVTEAFEQTNYDFNLIAFPGDEWTIKMMFNAAVYDREWIGQTAAHLTYLATTAVGNPEGEIRHMSVMPPEEKETMLESFTNLEAAYPEGTTINELFEEKAATHPDNVAVVLDGQQLTYRELNKKANQLARVLQEKGAGPDVLIGIMTERSIEMIISMVAVLKAGSAYVPIDPAYPSERIDFMLEDSGTHLLLTKEEYVNAVGYTGQIIDMSAMELDRVDDSNLDIRHTPKHLAYIIYTSGTTGKPKGVMISHRNVVRLLFNSNQPFSFSEQDAWTMFHSYCFDFSVWEMYGALLYGGKLVVVPKETAQSPNDFRQLLISENVTVLNQTPTAFSSLIQRELIEKSRTLKLRYVVFGGEALKPIMLKEWHEKYPETKLINMYGITETTVHVTYKEIGLEEINQNVSNIGRPIPTLGCYIMDKDLNMMPAGVAGELVVTGLGLARGYLNRPELTAERFLDHPFKAGERLYRSGDLARMLPSGELEYMGRLDHQVKIRGFRIELGEIEHQLIKINAVTEAVVVARTDIKGDAFLCAYVTTEKEVRPSDLLMQLKDSLPDYMVPAQLIQLDNIPVTVNGKLDLKALPRHEEENRRQNLEGPRNKQEALLAEIWQEVLGVEDIGINEDFFSIGGHSLKAMSLATKIHQQFDKEVPIKILFERSTISALAEYLSGAGDTAASVIEATPIQPYYPVSSAQKRLYILSQLEGTNDSYNIPAALLLKGPLDASRLEQAFQRLVNRHETLRTSFEMIEGELMQKIHADVPFRFERENASEEEADQRIAEFIRPFNLHAAPLFRAKLIQLSDDRHLLLIDMHHIITDGVSTGIYVKELTQLYKGGQLPEPEIQFKDFAVWQNGPQQLNEMKKLEQYWLDMFSDEIPVLELPTDYSRPIEKNLEGQRFVFQMNKDLTSRVEHFTKQTGTTLYMFLLSAFNIFLSKLTAQEDIIVGSPVAGRTHSQLTNVPGMFVNTIALRHAPVSSQSFKDFLMDVKETTLDAFAHQDYPFERLVDQLSLDRDTGRSALFDVMFNLQNMDKPAMQLDNLEISLYSIHSVSAKFDLTLEAVECDEGISLSFDYATTLFSQETINRWSQYLITIVESAVGNPDIHLSEMELLSEEERNDVLAASSGRTMTLTAGEMIHRRLEENLLKYPEQNAIVDAEKSVTYRELNKRSNQLAWKLRARGLRPDEPVAVLLDRSGEMVIAILAVMKAGGAYLPIDPDNPSSRIQFILEDSGVKMMVSEPRYSADFAELFTGEVLDILEESGHENKKENLPLINKAEDLAYIIYTSGTTGHPKGVMIEHRQVLHLIEGLNRQIYSHYGETALNIAMVAPFHFDASVQQMFASLLLGHTLFIVPGEVLSNGRQLAEYYRSHQIDIADGTPAHLQMLLTAGSDLYDLQLKHLILGGEALPGEAVQRFFTVFEQRNARKPLITNVYGPTECCVDASAFDIITVENKGIVPIGKPLGNNRLYILDTNGHLLPDGVPGELHIAGDGVGRGYLNLPELTAEKYIENPYVAGERMFRTGDIVRRCRNGEIEFLGRKDHQVKIRGYRIELGEVEAALLKHDQIKNAVVIAVSEAGKNEALAAYYTTDVALSDGTMREWLAEQLPNYMIPSYFIAIDTIPLTSNGKVDRRALPVASPESRTEKPYIAPVSQNEKLLCELWQDILGIEQIGIMDNFFSLGGHSLKAMALISAIQMKSGHNIPLKILFERPTVHGLTEYIKASGGNRMEDYTTIQPSMVQEYYPVSSAQKRMYILQQMDEQDTRYNMPATLMIEGNLDIPQLEKALQVLGERHESLRTGFPEREGIPVQKIHKQAAIQLKVTDSPEEKTEQLVHQFIRPFNLSEAPLFRTELIRYSSQRHLLMIDMHHIISDGVSSGILINELIRLYRGDSLTHPKLHYKDFSQWQNSLDQKEKIADQAQYWVNQFSGTLPVLELPTDFPRPSVQSFAGSSVAFEIDKKMTDHIYKLTTATGTTLHMFLLATLNIFLAKISGQEDIVVGTAVSGRTHPDLADMPGMFVNTLAIRNKPVQQKTFRTFLQEVKEISLQSLANQDYPFDELAGKLDVQRDRSRNPLFDVMLSLETGENDMFNVDGLNIRPYKMTNNHSKFDLTLAAFETGETIGLEFEYCSDLFTKETIKRWSLHLQNIISDVVETPDSRITDIEIMTAHEKEQITEDWNSTKLEVPVDVTFHKQFEEQVQKTPEQTAVTFKAQQWTYQELNTKANLLAHHLKDQGIQADQRVGIMVTPSIDMTAGILGILKAGGAFVPIDPNYPEQRISYMLSDSHASVLLISDGLTVPQAFEGKVINLNGFFKEETNSFFGNESNLQTATESGHLAYVIYTSGTSGQPKGVMVEHHSLVNLCYWHNHAFNVTTADRSAKYAGFGFDASVWELFPYWIAGAEVHIIEEDLRKDIIALNDYFHQKNITLTFLPTQLCEQFMELENHSLRLLLTGGDTLKRAYNKPYTLINNYGPTENTVVATSTPVSPNGEKLPIGRPIANTRLYILGKENQLQPIGVPGELCVAGRGLARGYINRPQETEERFVENPVRAGERIYRTGDMARWLEDGTVEYIGRMDQQVKIRGFRIELAEIESQLLEHLSVKDAAVSAVQHTNGSTVLCAYIVPAEEFEAEVIKQALFKRLPDYMVPQFFVTLTDLPMTPNGKVDKKSLPKPDVNAEAGDYKKPQSESEKLLVQVWEEVLNVSNIGITDNFFSLGGDSIKAIQMASRLHKAGWKLEMKNLFQNPTVEQVTPYLKETEDGLANQEAVEGEAILTPIQKWFFEQNFTAKHHWNQSFMLHAPGGLDEESVKVTLNKIIEHHDALRMIFSDHESEIVQYNQAKTSVDINVEIINFRDVIDPGRHITQLANDLQGSLQLSQGPLIKTAIFQTDFGDHLLIVIHHLVTDGVSWRILLEDFAAGYQMAIKGEPVVFQEKTTSFKEWGNVLNQYTRTSLFEKERDYWRKIESTVVPSLPKDNDVKRKLSKDTVALSVELTGEETQQLLTDVHRPYRTEINDILLCALGLAIEEWTGNRKVAVILEGHGREEIIQGLDVSRTVGWFTAQYPVVLEIFNEGSLSSIITTTKETLRNIPNKGVGYGLRRYLTEASNTEAADALLQPEITFNYLGQFDNETQTEFFGPSTYDMGSQVHPDSTALYGLNFSGIIRNGCLAITCSFNKQEYLRETITLQLDRFKNHLKDIINHCATKKDQEWTPSDFSAADLEMEEMGDIFDVLSGNLN